MHMPPQQQGQIPAQHMQRSWHSPADIPHRRELINNIIRLFQQRRPNIAKEWQKKLPDFVRRLESALYQSANSLEEYLDVKTLEQRLQTVARRMMMRGRVSSSNGQIPSGMPVSGQIQQMHGRQMPGQMGGPQHQMPHLQAMYNGRAISGTSTSMAHGGPNGVPVSQSTHVGIPADRMPPHYGMPRMHTGMVQQGQQQGQGQRDQSQQSGQQQPGLDMPPHQAMMVPGQSYAGHPNQHGGMSAHQGEESSGRPNSANGPVMSNGAPVLMRNASFLGTPSSSGPTLSTSGQQQVQRVTINGMAPGQLPGHSSHLVASSSVVQPGMPGPYPGMVDSKGNYKQKSDGMQMPAVSMPTSSQPSREEQRRLYIMKQIRWLLFLRHAHKCNAPEGQCSAGQHCVVARKLWAHVLKCTNPQCEYPRCVASRELLKHHQKCVDPRCPVCGPVREHINNQRNRQLAAEQYRLHQAQQEQQMCQPVSHMPGVSGPPGSQYHGGPKPLVVMPPAIPPKQEGGKFYQDGPPAKKIKMEPKAEKAARDSKATKDKNVQGTSLLECFSVEQINTHLASLRLETIGNTNIVQNAHAREAEGQKLIEGAGDHGCRACGAVRLTFEPPPMYCLSCNARIKKGQIYYYVMIDINKHSTCSSCYNSMKESFMVDGKAVPKSKLKKKKNEEELEEPWVQCDFCDAWVHQVCALFNKGRNEGGAGQYACPECLRKNTEKGKRQPIRNRPQAMLEAKDLSRTKLSDFLEKRLQTFLDYERGVRAKSVGKKPSEVPTAEGLTVRIVSVTDKVFSTMPKFFKQFEKDGCASELKYRCKILLLFQKVEGVDLCLFCMYVQEYGNDCPDPNSRRTYLSYLDSVRYFKPDGITAFGGDKNGRGDCLRTLVYQELIIGYLQYLKQRGFTSMYIWACPPLPGDDYIFYVHPQRQKTPKSDRLRDWYMRMLKRGKEQKIVMKTSNLWDLFFEGGKDHRVDPCRALDMPYFEGDYIPGALEEYLDKIHSEQEEEKKSAGKGKKKGAYKGSSSRGKGKRLANGTESVDTQVMSKLGDQIKNMKEDFIMVHLQPICSYCRKYILHPEKRFSCQQCPSFELCERCYKDDCGLDERSKHPTGSLNVHTFKESEAPRVPNTTDADPANECEIFDTRQTFLSLCQGNHYQFDTFRRAKHSSMMVLYHLHNPSAPAFTSSCNVCSRELEPGQGYRCTVCPDYDVCISCKSKPEFKHEHELKKHSGDLTRVRRISDEERRARQEQLRKTMQLLVHASSCKDPKCPHPSCMKVKMLFQHSLNCQLKATGGCHYCRRMWALLQLHAKSCTVRNCPVPRCRDLKQYRRYAQAQAEKRRRMHYHKMMNSSRQSGS